MYANKIPLQIFQKCRFLTTIPFFTTKEQLDFSRHEHVAQSKSIKELIRARMLLIICSKRIFVLHSQDILRISRSVIGDKLLFLTLKVSTFKEGYYSNKTVN